VRDSSGRSGTGETPQVLRTEDAHRPPRGSLSILERKSTTPPCLFKKQQSLRKQQKVKGFCAGTEKLMEIEL
jgi:hypothetical protein